MLRIAPHSYRVLRSLSSAPKPHDFLRTGFRNMSDVVNRLDHDAVADLFSQYARDRGGLMTLDCDDLRRLRAGIGEDPADDDVVRQLFQVADLNDDGMIDEFEFLEHADTFLGSNPARIILVVGGPGSGKGSLCQLLCDQCSVVHLSSGELLRNEVARNTQLGKQVASIMASGELVSSATIVALMKKRMRNHPGKRVLLDGFPRSVENANDLVTLCGRPELALHLQCSDTVLLERMLSRAGGREDDNFQTALARIRTFHKYHNSTLEWLQNEHVPIVNLDCSGSKESVWQQLLAIGKLMRPAVKRR